MSLYSLVYVSYARDDMSDAELSDLLAKSRENNAALGITGMLLYHNESFMQYLEGEKEEVLELYDRIAIDDRHTGVTLYFEREIEERNFADWSMGFNKIEDADVEGLPGYTDFLEKPETAFFTEKPSRAQVLLNHFKDRTYF